MEGALTLIAGGERLEDIEVLRADASLCENLGVSKIISPDTLREFLKIKRSGGSLPGFVAGTQRYLVVHPLWDTVNLTGILRDAVTAAGGRNIQFMDTFNLLRRPGWYRQHMG